jgi:hypothetical protein
MDTGTYGSSFQIKSEMEEVPGLYALKFFNFARTTLYVYNLSMGQYLILKVSITGYM